MADSRPIGVFDSGVGGLSVLREIRALLPAESLIYCADSGYAPYGEKSPEQIRQRSLLLSRFLLDQGAKALVIACNTATAAAAKTLRAEWPELPIIGMEPAVKPAVKASRNGVVGVLATTGTLASAQFAALLDNFGRDVRVVTRPGSGLVECVEQGALDSPQTRTLLQSHLQVLIEAGTDTIVLGCTHYVFLRPLIAELVGPRIAIVDTGEAVARQLQRLLLARDVLAPAGSPAQETFWTSGELAQAQRVLHQVWNQGTSCHLIPSSHAA